MQSSQADTMSQDLPEPTKTISELCAGHQTSYELLVEKPAEAAQELPEPINNVSKKMEESKTKDLMAATDGSGKEPYLVKTIKLSLEDKFHLITRNLQEVEPLSLSKRLDKSLLDEVVVTGGGHKENKTQSVYEPCVDKTITESCFGHQFPDEFLKARAEKLEQKEKDTLPTCDLHSAEPIELPEELGENAESKVIIDCLDHQSPNEVLEAKPEEKVEQKLMETQKDLPTCDVLSVKPTESPEELRENGENKLAIQVCLDKSPNEVQEAKPEEKVEQKLEEMQRFALILPTCDVHSVKPEELGENAESKAIIKDSFGQQSPNKVLEEKPEKVEQKLMEETEKEIIPTCDVHSAESEELGENASSKAIKDEEREIVVRQKCERRPEGAVARRKNNRVGGKSLIREVSILEAKQPRTDNRPGMKETEDWRRKDMHLRLRKQVLWSRSQRYAKWSEQACDWERAVEELEIRAKEGMAEVRRRERMVEEAEHEIRSRAHGQVFRKQQKGEHYGHQVPQQHPPPTNWLLNWWKGLGYAAPQL